jgi:hypothetical protein
MRRTFPYAAVSGHQTLIPAMTNAPKDRHVLAAAVRVGAAVIVTANLTDFPAYALDQYDIEVMHPDEFLLDQLDLYPKQMHRCLIEQRTAYNKPTLSMAEFIASLRRTVPRFADQIGSEETARTRNEDP